MSIYVYIIAGGAAFLYVYFRLLRTQNASNSLAGRRSMPGPKRVPFFGNIFQLLGKPFHLVIRDWSLEYGPVFKYDIFGTEIVAVNGYEALREVLQTKGHEFGGRPERSQMEKDIVSGRGFTDCDMSPFWRSVRRSFHATLKLYGSGVAHFEENIHCDLQDLMEVFESKNQAPFDCYEDVHNMLTSFICTLLAGKRLKRDHSLFLICKEIDAIIRKRSDVFVGRYVLIKFPWLRHIFNADLRALQHNEDNFRKFWNEFVFPLKDTEEFKAGRGLVANLYRQQQKQQQEQQHHENEEGQEYDDTKESNIISDDDLRRMIKLTIIAGIVTTTSSLYALLNIFLHYPDVQERAAEEVASKIDVDQRVTLSHKTDLPYIRAVVLELLRFTSIATHGLPHKAVVDSEIQGYPVRKGTMVMTCLYVHHTNSKEWVEPYVFNPDRFLDEDGSLLAPDHPNRKKLFPFGSGPRACLGEQLASNRLFIATATFVQRFRFLPPKGEPLVSCDPRDWAPSSAFVPTSYRVRAVPRNDKI